MKYGFCLWSLSNDIIESIYLAKKAGAECVSLGFTSEENGTFPLCNQEFRYKVLQTCGNVSVELCCLGVNELCKYGMSKPENEEKVLKILDMALDTAISMSIPIIQLPSFVDGSIQSEDDFVQTAKCLSYISKKAAKYGILVGHESTLNCEQNERMQQLVGSDNLFLYFDGGNLVNAHSENPETLIRTMYPKIYQIHIKDCYSLDEKGKKLGEGTAHVQETVNALIDVGYHGDWLLENNYTNHFELAAVDLENLRQWVEG